MRQHLLGSSSRWTTVVVTLLICCRWNAADSRSPWSSEQAEWPDRRTADSGSRCRCRIVSCPYTTSERAARDIGRRSIAVSSMWTCCCCCRRTLWMSPTLQRTTYASRHRRRCRRRQRYYCTVRTNRSAICDGLSHCSRRLPKNQSMRSRRC